MTITYRLCHCCMIGWNRKAAFECPKCNAHAFFTMNSDSIGFAMYLQEQNLTMGDFEIWDISETNHGLEQTESDPTEQEPERT